ncbi:hypothetical protein XENOCAPTIV_023848 [Xenoophorus captivus]|uniref:Lipocalin/cytosolic fatty-acid binding domain-containing protein n=1 Tax=Xenoophorus captivus TaxID=1517983 RepID=A0ABV0QWD8_9TELE
MRFVDVVYDDYAVVHTIKTKEGVSEVLNKLYSRSNETSTDLQQKFLQFSQETGVLSENIVILPKNGLSSKWHLLPPNRITGSVTKLHLRL